MYAIASIRGGERLQATGRHPIGATAGTAKEPAPVRRKERGYKMKDVFEALLHSRKFWLMVVGLVQTVLFQFVPDFPMEVWLAIDGLLAVVITTIAVEDAAAKRAGTLGTL